MHQPECGVPCSLSQNNTLMGGTHSVCSRCTTMGLVHLTCIIFDIVPERRPKCLGCRAQLPKNLVAAWKQQAAHAGYAHRAGASDLALPSPGNDVKFKVQRHESGAWLVVYKLSRTEWLSDAEHTACDEESATGDVDGGVALLREAAQLLGAQPAQLLDAMDALPRHTAALENGAVRRLLELCGDLLVAA